jgi:hypothetical protein
MTRTVMRAWWIGLAALALGPGFAQAQMAPGDDYRPYAQAEAQPGRYAPSDLSYDDQQVPALIQRQAPALPYRGPVDPRAYYRDFWPAPQYGYTYGSAHGRGYGYSYEDDAPYEAARAYGAAPRDAYPVR